MNGGRIAFLILMLALACAASAHAGTALPPIPARGTLQAAFAPEDDVERLLTDEIDGARSEVLVQAYLLTSRRIADALIRAQRRGVDVRVLLDAKQSGRVPSSKAARLAAAGIRVALEVAYENAHNKVIVIDAALARASVVTGSYNFTWTAQHRNAENVLIVRADQELARRYRANWERHRQAAVPYSK